MLGGNTRPKLLGDLQQLCALPAANTATINPPKTSAAFMFRASLFAVRRDTLGRLSGSNSWPTPRNARLASQFLSLRAAGQLRWIGHDTVGNSDSEPGNDGPQSTEPPSKQHSGPERVAPYCTGLEPYNGHEIVVSGFLGKRRNMPNMTFCALKTGTGANIQITSTPADERGDLGDLHEKFKSIPSYSSVQVTGTLKVRHKKNVATADPVKNSPEKWDLQLSDIEVLSSFPKDIIVSKDTVWPLSARHLQMRFDPLLRSRLLARSQLNTAIRERLTGKGFHEFETPVLFKSTPEGAREFLVPTRQPGMAYALPQSPQQYKQILMAGGMFNYFQFAKCFRDEDSRADRQPEFTQLDIEMSFASGADVRHIVEEVMRKVFSCLNNASVPRQIGGLQFTRPSDLKKHYGNTWLPGSAITCWPGFPGQIPLIKYQDAMRWFGSDKPDLRIPSRILQITDRVTDSFVRQITSLEKPIVDAAHFRLKGSLAENAEFIRGFMDNLPKSTLNLNPTSTPGVFVYDVSKPLNGLDAFGHEAACQIMKLYQSEQKLEKLKHGDILIVHAREDIPFRGEGWTDMGRLRKAIYDSAVEKGLLDRDLSFKFCWIHEFPLFTPDDQQTAAGEGQGGLAGIKATHHPFTAPCGPVDLREAKNPLDITADHYDFVLNGVEIGGGSVRIHDAATQEYVFKELLKMPPEAMGHFDHLLGALRSGCPPHAGFALGWDRFLTILFDVDSVRDVIPFPKNQKGEDLLAKSPSPITPEQMATYHLTLKRS